MAGKQVPLGPTGKTVRNNIARFRGNTEYKTLSERVTAAGRYIPPLGLRRIEAGERRVDVDDLMALAVVFGVSPLTLLLPPDGSSQNASQISGVEDVAVGHNVQWLYGLAEEPLRVPLHQARRDRATMEYKLRSRPFIDPRVAGGGYSSSADSSVDDAEARAQSERHLEGQMFDWNA